MRKFSRYVTEVFPIFMLFFTMFVFAPAYIFINNKNEFFFSFGDIFPLLLLFLVLTFCFAFLIFKIFQQNKLIRRSLVAFFYAFFFSLYIQGNILSNDFGVLNGESINWSAHTISAFVSTILWIVIFAATFFSVHKYETKSKPVLNFACVIILVLQIFTLIYENVKNPVKEIKKDLSLTTDREFSLSKNQNTIVFLLDCFDASVLKELLENTGIGLENSFTDFTFYENMSGGATRTKYAIPYIFTGKTNTEPISYTDYLIKSFQESKFVKSLKNSDIDARILTEFSYVSMEETKAFDNISGAKPQISSHLKLTYLFGKLSAFRYAPVPIKRFFLLYSDDFGQFKKISGKGGSYSIDDVNFFNRMKNNVTADFDIPVFRFYHLMGPHSPYTMSENCERIPVSQGTEERQALGSLKIVVDFITQMKKLGIYDNSTIFVMADHGERGSIEQNPLFMLKERNENKPFSISNTAATYKDLVSMFKDSVEGKKIDIGKNYSHEGEERFCYVQAESNSKLNIVEYSSTSLASDASSWRPTGIIYHGNTEFFSNEYKIGTTLSFMNDGTANLYCRSGFSKNEGSHTWTVGTESEMFFKLNSLPVKNLTLRMRYGTFLDNQRVGISVNGRILEEYIAKAGTKDVLIPKSLIEKGDIILHFYLPDANSPKNLGTSGDSRLMTLSMKEISFLYADEACANRLDPKNKEELYASGIYSFEKDFVWTKPFATVTLQNKKISKKGLALNLAIPSFVGEQNPELRIFVNGLLYKKMNTTPGELDIYFPPEEVSSFDDIYEIRIEHDFSFVPKELGINDDTRELSLQVSYIGEKR